MNLQLWKEGAAPSLQSFQIVGQEWLLGDTTWGVGEATWGGGDV